MNWLQIALLALLQGLAELLPVSSSAHVILAQHLMGLDPSSPEMTFLLVMLHTGTMFAVLVYFWPKWKERFKKLSQQKSFIKALIVATAATGVLGLALKFIIEKFILEKALGYPKGEVEQLFRMLPLVASALFVVGLFIIYAGRKKITSRSTELSDRQALGVGLIQGLTLPFRGLSRSGATISMALLQGMSRELAEEFSFALAVILTPAVVVLELRRLLHHAEGVASPDLGALLLPGLVGMVFSFAAGLLALRWLSAWLERGRWAYFGYYCLVLAVIVFGISFL